MCTALLPSVVVCRSAQRVLYLRKPLSAVFAGGELGFVEREQPAGAGSDPANVVDFGYPIGSIQVPGGVEPIVLMNDAVTGGGYATIGTVISVDRDTLAQTKTNDKTRFRSVDLEEALEARKQRWQKMEEIRQSLS